MGIGKIRRVQLGFLQECLRAAASAKGELHVARHVAWVPKSRSSLLSR